MNRLLPSPVRTIVVASVLAVGGISAVALQASTLSAAPTSQTVHTSTQTGAQAPGASSSYELAPVIGTPCGPRYLRCAPGQDLGATLDRLQTQTVSSGSSPIEVRKGIEVRRSIEVRRVIEVRKAIEVRRVIEVRA